MNEETGVSGWVVSGSGNDDDDDDWEQEWK